MLKVLVLACAVLLACEPSSHRTVTIKVAPDPLRTAAERSGYATADEYSDVIAFLSALARERPGSIDVWSPGYGRDGHLIPYAVVARPMVPSTPAAHRTGRPVVFVRAGGHGTDGDGTDGVLQIARALTMSGDSALLDSVVLVAAPVIDTDRGWVSAAAPEIRVMLSTLPSWQPDIVVDLGVGSSTPVTLRPPTATSAVLTGPYIRDTLVPALAAAVGAEGIGVWVDTAGPPDLDLTINYFAVRGRLALRATTDARDSLAARVRAMRVVVREALVLAARRRHEIIAVTAGADTTTEDWGANAASAPRIPIAPDRSVQWPSVYALPAGDSATRLLLARHGITISRLAADRSVRLVERYLVDSAGIGHWSRTAADTTLKAGTYLVSTSQRLGLLAMLLLEPESPDLIAPLAGGTYPIVRILY